eukprot:CAMPEP_0115356778 /NCGR_PEP_ID=MMETSP0270-20121206/99791_1 /TAXON_ID=71861 /ORGANISM="Scrippsiella trochoidea, Strain CCMP3099" /LENGTH=60 /DNA_ID=CAMNT_0002779181 /DNA_START=53 /DNA_END=232 /DNA_ORIENTATION=-
MAALPKNTDASKISRVDEPSSSLPTLHSCVCWAAIVNIAAAQSLLRLAMSARFGFRAITL